MVVTLPADLDRAVREKVSSGEYANVLDFIRTAILQALDSDQRKKEKLDEAILSGAQQADNGQFSKLSIQEIIDSEERKVLADR